MNELHSWALSLCGAAVICGILGCVMPEKLGGKTVLSLFFLCILAAPLNHGMGDLNINFPDQEEAELSAELETESNQLAYSIAEDHILELIRETLFEENFPTDSIRLNIEDEEENVDLELKLVLPASMKNRENELCQLMQNSFGIKNMEIIWQEEK